MLILDRILSRTRIIYYNRFQYELLRIRQGHKNSDQLRKYSFQSNHSRNSKIYKYDYYKGFYATALTFTCLGIIGYYLLNRDEKRIYDYICLKENLPTYSVGNLKDEQKEKNEQSVSPVRCKVTKIVPRISAEEYRLELAVANKIILTLKLEDLKQYPQYTVVSAIPCKNNFQEHENAGVKLGPKWTGTRLCDVLLHLDVNVTEFDQLHFVCLDSNQSQSAYSASIRITQSIDSVSDVLLAYQMNDEELTPEHGYPVRVVMPRLAGSKNVKWIRKIVLTKDETLSLSDQRKDKPETYKMSTKIE